MSELTHPTLRPMLPRLSACLLILGLAVFAVSLCVNPGRANDIFWQLRTGHWIVQHHAAPHSDMYSWTRAGVQWVAHEWLTFAIFWLAYAWKGFGGLWLFTAFLAIVIIGLLYVLILNETAYATGEHERSPMTAFVLTALAAITSAAFFQPRPQMFTYLLTLITLAVVLRVRRAANRASGHNSTSAMRPLWALPPLYLIWANLHAGVLVGIGILILFTMVDAIAAYQQRTKAGPHQNCSWKTMTQVSAVGLLASLATPYGVHEYQNFVATILNTTAINAVSEWASPNFHDSFGQMLEFFAGLVMASLFLTRLRHDAAELTLITVLAHEALSGSRNVPIFVLVVSVLVARHFQSALITLLYGRSTVAPPADSLFGPAPSPIIAAAVAVALGLSSAARVSSSLKTYAPPTRSMLDRIALASVDYGAYPARACDFIDREPFPSGIRMYNTYDDGGYLIWRLPNRPVFIDSRADVYFGPMLEEVKKITDGALDWRKTMDSRGVDMIVAPVSEAQSRDYLAAPDWALVYVDFPDFDKPGKTYATRNNTFIFLRRKPAYASLIARCRRDCPALVGGSLAHYQNYLSLR